jgi:hypothetical protein
MGELLLEGERGGSGFFWIPIRESHSGSDDGIWRRIRVVPFSVQIPEEKCDPDIAAEESIQRGCAA